MRGFKRGGGIPELSGVSVELIAELCGVHVSTARRWKRGEMPPLSALKVIALHDTGELGAITPYWNGWQLKGGMMIAPDGQRFSPGDVLAGPFWKQLVKSYQLEQQFERQADWIAEKYVPAVELESKTA